MSCDSAHHLQRLTFPPGRQDPYLRLATFAIFARNDDITLLIARCKDSEELPPHSPVYDLDAAGT